jgi:membrane-bound lytic murein transglycosylase MltF
VARSLPIERVAINVLPDRLQGVGHRGSFRGSAQLNSPAKLQSYNKNGENVKDPKVNGMSTFTELYRVSPVPMIALFGVLSVTGCGKETSSPSVATPQLKPQGFAEREELSLTQLSPDEPPLASNTLVLPLYHHYTDDLDAMVKRHTIRAIVTINPIGFFYDNGVPRGLVYETLEEFQRFANRTLKTGRVGIKVRFIPVRIDQLEAALKQGIGDFIAWPVAVTAERGKRVAFSTPLQTGVTEIIVSGPEYAAVSTLQGFGGKQVFVNPLSNYYDNLKKVNDLLKKNDETPIQIREADKSLDQDDLVQMVNAGLIPATVTTQKRAGLWSQVLPNLKPHSESIIGKEGNLAWAMRKENPQLKHLLVQFVMGHKEGTTFGNVLLRRYLQNTKWVTNSTSGAAMEKFRATVEIFKKYATQYDFDFLMLAAQGYQESMLNQAMISHRGAVGIMQVMPKFAAAPPISIPDVSKADGNIHAGAKMLRHIADTRFNDPEINRLDKTLFTFASYNAGPNRISGLRKKAAEMNLDPNVWFDNVELVAAEDIGEETVTYVRNIYKYYVAYKLAADQARSGPKARSTSSPFSLLDSECLCLPEAS